MNKCIKKIRIFALDFVIKSLGKGVSYDLFKKLSNDFGIEAVTVSGDSGQITGAPSELIMGSYIRHGLYNPDIVNLITKRLLTNGAGTFIDIGANIGAYTPYLGQAAGVNGVVYAFEPFRNLYQVLTANIALNGLSNTWTFNFGQKNKKTTKNKNKITNKLFFFFLNARFRCR